MYSQWKQIVGAVAISSVMFAGGAQAAVNLLANPDFEANTGGANASGGDVSAPVGGTTYPWQSYSTYFPPFSGYYTAVTAHTGTQSMKTFGAPNSGIFQQVGVTAGNTYTASVYIENFSNDALTGGAAQTEDVRLTFFDPNGTPIGGAQISPTHVDGTTAKDVWTLVSVTAVAPVGAVYTDFRAFQFNQSGAGGALYIDDASLTNVTAAPEPASIGLLGLASVSLLRRRRA